MCERSIIDCQRKRLCYCHENIPCLHCEYHLQCDTGPVGALAVCINCDAKEICYDPFVN